MPAVKVITYVMENAKSTEILKATFEARDAVKGYNKLQDLQMKMQVGFVIKPLQESG